MCIHGKSQHPTDAEGNNVDGLRSSSSAHSSQNSQRSKSSQGSDDSADSLRLEDIEVSVIDKINSNSSGGTETSALVSYLLIERCFG